VRNLRQAVADTGLMLAVLSTNAPGVAASPPALGPSITAPDRLRRLDSFERLAQPMGPAAIGSAHAPSAKGSQVSGPISEAWLKTAEMEVIGTPSKGYNRREANSFIVRLTGTDGRVAKGLFKTNAWELRNEVAASKVNDALGRSNAPASLGDLVPLTVTRHFMGKDGSLQLWVEDASMSFELPDAVIARTPLEKLFVLDYGLGNGDRFEKKGNLLLKSRSDGLFDPVAIDFGCAIHDTPEQAGFVTDQLSNHWPKSYKGPQSEETLAFIAGMDLKAIAGAFAAARRTRSAAKYALRRFRHMQLDPSIVQIGRSDIAANVSIGGQGLSKEERDGIDELILEAYGPQRWVCRPAESLVTAAASIP
jgi:hypothetical protein